jgi:splicing factor 45
VLLLLNVAGPGEIDNDLYTDITEECQQYGRIDRVVMFVMPNAPEDEKLRIFIKFKT